MSELAGLLGVICALISLRCYWRNNSGIERPRRKVNGKKGEIKNLVLCSRNYFELPIGMKYLLQNP